MSATIHPILGSCDMIADVLSDGLRSGQWSCMALTGRHARYWAKAYRSDLAGAIKAVCEAVEAHQPYVKGSTLTVVAQIARTGQERSERGRALPASSPTAIFWRKVERELGRANNG